MPSFDPALYDLVIGVGNPLRGDDALGRRLADAFAARERPGLIVISCRQLTPELCEEIARAHRVLFVDAGPTTALAPIAPDTNHLPTTHRMEPGALLALAELLYGRAPEADLFTLEARDFGLGAPLSPPAEAALAAALERLQASLRPGALEGGRA